MLKLNIAQGRCEEDFCLIVNFLFSILFVFDFCMTLSSSVILLLLLFAVVINMFSFCQYYLVKYFPQCKYM